MPLTKHEIGLGVGGGGLGCGRASHTLCVAECQADSVFRCDADLVSFYALELLDALLHMLRLAYNDPPALGTAELAAAAIDHLERILEKKVRGGGVLSMDAAVVFASCQQRCSPRRASLREAPVPDPSHRLVATTTSPLAYDAVAASAL